MSDAVPGLISPAPWRARIVQWRKALAGALAAPKGETLLRLSSEEVAILLRNARGTDKPDSAL